MLWIFCKIWFVFNIKFVLNNNVFFIGLLLICFLLKEIKNEKKIWIF